MSKISNLLDVMSFGKVENIGVEPMTSCMPCKRSSQLSYRTGFKLSAYVPELSFIFLYMINIRSKEAKGFRPELSFLALTMSIVYNL